MAQHHSPCLGELDPQGLRALGNLISRTACRFALDLDQLSTASAKRQAAGPETGQGTKQEAGK